MLKEESSCLSLIIINLYNYNAFHAITNKSFKLFYINKKLFRIKQCSIEHFKKKENNKTTFQKKIIKLTQKTKIETSEAAFIYCVYYTRLYFTLYYYIHSTMVQNTSCRGCKNRLFNTNVNFDFGEADLCSVHINAD